VGGGGGLRRSWGWEREEEPSVVVDEERGTLVRGSFRSSESRVEEETLRSLVCVVSFGCLEESRRRKLQAGLGARSERELKSRIVD